MLKSVIDRGWKTQSREDLLLNKIKYLMGDELEDFTAQLNNVNDDDQ